MTDILTGIFEICPYCKTRVELRSAPQLKLHLYGKCPVCGLSYEMGEGMRKIKFEK
jgi:uncharacterized protein YbaR (Trm112 family)